MPDTPPLHKAFIDRTLAQWSDGAELLRAIETGRKQVGLRKNPSKPAELPWRLSSVPWEPNGYYLQEDAQPGASLLHAVGALYMQEPSAMSAAPLLKARPGQTILDLCAAPGGKSGQLAAAMRGEGLLVCNEAEPSRAPILAQNLERLGVRNALITCMRPDALAKHFLGAFDGVLIDAPCSGEGMFRRDPASRAAWTPDAPSACARRQVAILKSAALMVRPGGHMVYSTCTFNREENEDVVCAFIAENPAFALCETRRIFPHRDRGEGHFCALLAKNAQEPMLAVPALDSDETLRAPWQAFAKELFADAALAKLPLARMGDALYALPPGCPSLHGLRVLRAGIKLAHIRKNRLEPAHALAMALSREQARRIADVDDEQAALYLRGHPLPLAGPRGWALVCYSGLALGWGKFSDGTLKNHLPKGLRWL